MEAEGRSEGCLCGAGEERCGRAVKTMWPQLATGAKEWKELRSEGMEGVKDDWCGGWEEGAHHGERER